MSPILSLPPATMALFWLPTLACAVVEVALPAQRALRALLSLAGPVAVLGVVGFLWPEVAGQSPPLATFLGDGFGRFALGTIWVLAFFAIALRRGEEPRSADGGDTLLLLSAAGGSLLVLSADLFATLSGFALTLVPVWGLASVSGRIEGREAALKGLLAGVLSLVLFALGSALILAATGHSTLAGIGGFLRDLPPGEALPPLLAPGVALLLGGLGLFVAAVPLHMWFSDLAEGLPASASLWLTGGVLVAGLAVSARILLTALLPLAQHPQIGWVELLRGVGLVALLVANAVALVQSRLQRMAGYLAAGQTGFLLLGIAAAGEVRGEGEHIVGGILVFLLVHALTWAGLYAGFSRLTGPEPPRVSHLEGLARQRPWLAAVMGLALLCLSGMPLTAGFFSRLVLLEAMVSAGWTGTAVLAALSLGLVLVMSLGLVAAMVMRPPTSASPRPTGVWPALAAAVTAVAILAIGFLPGGVLRVALQAARSLALGF